MISVMFNIKGNDESIFKNLVNQARSYVANGNVQEGKFLLGALYGCMSGSLREAAKLELAIVERDFGDISEYHQLKQEIRSQCEWAISDEAAFSYDDRNEYIDILEKVKAN